MGWIIFREILPNALSPLVSEIGLRFIFSVLFLSALSLLGLGLQPPEADWGGMVMENKDGVSLALKCGKVLGLIGESGAGKSTIGLSSMGYGRGGCRITGGEVFLNGRDIIKAGVKGLRRLRGSAVCYVAQSAAAAFNPAHRLIDQVGRLRCSTVTLPAPKPRNAPWHCLRNSACPIPTISANVIRTRSRAVSCSVS